MIMPSMDRNDVLFLYRQMLLIRRFEEKSAEMYALAKIAGFLHLYIGEEAIAESGPSPRFDRMIMRSARTAITGTVSPEAPTPAT